MGLLLSVAIDNVPVALAIAPVVSVMLMILGGFYIPFSHIPAPAEWLEIIGVLPLIQPPRPPSPSPPQPPAPAARCPDRTFAPAHACP